MQTILSSTTRLDEAGLLRLRVWAVRLRDDGPAELASQSRTLIHLIDLRPKLMARNVREDTDRSIFMLVGKLVAGGASAPP